MSGQLTPFPDGEGYLEHAWTGLSPPMCAVLFGGPGDRRVATVTAMQRRGLLDERWRLTARGEALRSWAVLTGRWTS